MRGKLKTLLFVNHKGKKCGIYQYGLHIYDIIKTLPEFDFHYVECATRKDVHRAILNTKCDAVVYNYHHRTMPFLHKMSFLFKLPFLHWFRLSSIPVLRRFSFLRKISKLLRSSFSQKLPYLHPKIKNKHKECIHICLVHYMTQQVADILDDRHFQYYIYADPTLVENNPRVFKTGRLLPKYEKVCEEPKVVTIGSYGFGGVVKGFEHLVDVVQKEFDEAIIRLNIPSNDVGDKYGLMAKNIRERCNALIRKPGIQLKITHEFFDDEQLLDFLSQNTLNAFLYHETKSVGIASAPDFAIAAKRPIAVTRCNLFKHLFSIKPSVLIEESSLKEIISNGVEPLTPLFTEWGEENLLQDYKRILERIFYY